MKIDNAKQQLKFIFVEIYNLLFNFNNSVIFFVLFFSGIK